VKYHHAQNTIATHTNSSPEYESNIIVIYFCIDKESSFEIDSSELVIPCNKINIQIAMFGIDIPAV
jgi:hypothetical protein